jgi:thiamine kinase-like enzyme
VGEVTEIAERLQSRLGRLDRAPIPLDGGITNRNFRVSFAGRECVLRLPGKDTALLGISRQAERIAGEAAARLHLAPAVVLAEPDCLLTVYVPCRSMLPADVRTLVEPVARALRAFHDSGTQLPATFWVPELVESYARLVTDRGHTLPNEFPEAAKIVVAIAEALPLREPAPCHNDLLHGNLLGVAGGGVLLVDWEYAGMGNPLFDLGNLAVNNEFDEDTEQHLLRAYFGEPPRPADAAALRLMRVMSDAREAMWGVVQAAVSDLDFDFAAYSAKHFERLIGATHHPRWEEWLHAASA